MDVHLLDRLLKKYHLCRTEKREKIGSDSSIGYRHQVDLPRGNESCPSSFFCKKRKKKTFLKL